MAAHETTDSPRRSGLVTVNEQQDRYSLRIGGLASIAAIPIDASTLRISAMASERPPGQINLSGAFWGHSSVWLFYTAFATLPGHGQLTVLSRHDAAPATSSTDAPL